VRRRDFLAALPATGLMGGQSDGGRLRVRLRDEHGAPTAARIYLRDAQGNPHTPPGSIARQIARSSEWYFHASGEFEIAMPPGAASIEAVKGFEYIPVRESVHLSSGGEATVTLVLRRWIDMPGLGWHSSDVHIHPNHVEGGLYTTMKDCLLYASAEDIRVANLLISNTDTAHVFDTEFFRGGEPDPLSTRDTMLVVQEEFRNTSAMYGHMPLLGISRLVKPFFSGQPDSPDSEDYPPNYMIAKAAREQGGAVCYSHPANRPGTPVGPHLAREFPIDLALGVVDALDVLGNGDEEAACWMYYRALNCGLKCAASSGSDTRLNVPRHSVAGGGRVYVNAGAAPAYRQWVAAYKAGRTFVSNGPMLFLDVDGQEPGAELNFASPRNVKVTARAQSLVPMSSLEIIVNGRVAVNAAPDAGGTHAEIVQNLHLNESSWIAARVWGGPHRLVVNDPKLFAHTSPVYCRVAGQRIAFREDAGLVLAWIDRLTADVASSPRFATEQHRREVLDVFSRARAYYEAI
jgi:hypothetical protein